MKKTFILMLLLIGAWIPAAAQKFALVDMEYILRNVPSHRWLTWFNCSLAIS